MRAWLHERNVEVQERDFFQRPFTEAELRALLTALPQSPTPPLAVSPSNQMSGQETSARPTPIQTRAALLFSWKSPAFKTLGRSPDALDGETLIRLMLQEPRLIRRPIVRIGDTLILGADWPALEQAIRPPSR